jgi:hypothetical protein
MILVRTGHQEGEGDRENGLPSSFVQTVTEYVQRDFSPRLATEGEEQAGDVSTVTANPVGESDALPVDTSR